MDDTRRPRKKVRVERIENSNDSSSDLSRSLSDEMLMLILSFLNHKDLAVTSRLSRRWAEISNDLSLWRRLFNGTFPETLPVKKLSMESDGFATRLMQTQEDWKTMFQLQHNWSIGRFHQDWICQKPRGSAHVMHFSRHRIFYSVKSAICIFDSNSRRHLTCLVSPFDERIQPSCLCTDSEEGGSRALVGYDHGGWALFDVVSGSILSRFSPLLGSTKSLCNVTISRSIVVTLSQDFVLRVFHIQGSNVTLKQSLLSSICSHPAALHINGPDLMIFYSQTFFDGTASPGMQVLSLSQNGFLQPCVLRKPTVSFEAVQGTLTSIQFHPPLILTAFSNNQVHIYRDTELRIQSSLYLSAAPTCLAMDGLGKLVLGTPTGFGVWRLPSSLSLARDPQVYIVDPEWKLEVESGHPRIPVYVGFDEGYLVWMDRLGRIQSYAFI